MKKRNMLRILYAAGAAVCCITCAVPLTSMAEQQDSTINPQSAAVPVTQAADQSILRATLKNGLRVVIVRNHLAPVVTTAVNYLVGSNEAPTGFPGMAHAQEHMMFRGSPELSAAQLANISAVMGGHFDADTRQTITQYLFTVPAEDLGVALHVEAIRMRGVLDSDALWDKERGAIEQEVAQDLSNPKYIFYSKLLAAMFKGTPYAHDALGTRPSFNKTSGKMLKDFYKKWYVPNNAILVIAGDIQPQAVLAKVKMLFGDIPSKPLPKRPAITLQPVKSNKFHMDTDLPYKLSVIAFRMPGYNSPDYAAATVLADALSSQRGDLYALVPQGKALYTGLVYNPFPDAGMGMIAAALPAGADSEGLLKNVRAIVKKTLKEGVSADLVEAAKRHEVADAEFEKNSVSGLASAWSDALALEGRSSPEDDVRAIKAVTVKDVNRVARKYIDFDHSIVAVLTPQASGKPVSSTGFGGKESFAPSETRAVKLPVWAKKELADLHVPKSTLNPIVKMLPNGIKLIVQPESVSDTISVYGSIRNNPDMQVPKGQEGVSEILDGMFEYGTTSLNRLAFQKALDDIAADESAGTSFSVEVQSEHFDRAVALLADNELHPALPKSAFIVTRRQLAATVKGRLSSPSFLTHQALRKALFPKGDPSLRHATPETIKALDLNELRTYYKNVFRPDLTTIVVIGKVTPKKAEDVISHYFGKWHAVGAKPVTLLPAVPNNKPSITGVPDRSRVQDNVIIAQTLGIKRSDPDYYSLELGNHVLGGAFYATRLYHDLREKTGLVYFVSSSFNVGKTRATYLVNYACDPPNVSKVRAIVVRDLKEMQDSVVTPDELKLAKALLLRSIPLSVSSIDSIADGFLERAELDLPLDEPIRAARFYMKLDAQQVKAAFAKWLRPADLVQVTEGPNGS
jgi:zinc protease